MMAAKRHSLGLSATGMKEWWKILVGRDGINLEKPYNGSRTPLSWAAIIAQEEVVKILPQ